MIAFNMVVIDLLPYGQRALFHSSNLEADRLILSYVLLTLLVLDLIEITHLGSRSKIKDESLRMHFLQYPAGKFENNSENLRDESGEIST